MDDATPFPEQGLLVLIDACHGLRMAAAVCQQAITAHEQLRARYLEEKTQAGVTIATLTKERDDWRQLAQEWGQRLP